MVGGPLNVFETQNSGGNLQLLSKIWAKFDSIKNEVLYIQFCFIDARNRMSN